MNRSLRHLALAAALPLALGLSACGEKSQDGAQASSEPIASIAPPAGKAWADMVSRTPEGGYLMGNPEAPIKLIEFGALSCSHCADFAKEADAELRDTFVASGRVSYELRLFLLNALDMPAALLVTCGAPETVPALATQFWAWQPTMFENLQAAGDARMKAVQELPPQQRFAGIASAAGMDTFINTRGIAADQAKACLADGSKAASFAQQNESWSKQYEITGTPTFFLNGAKIDAGTWAEVKASLEAAGAR